MKVIWLVSVFLVLDIVSCRYGKHDYFQTIYNEAEDTYQDDKPELIPGYLKLNPMK